MIIAFDIGGTNTRGAVYDNSFNKLDYFKIPTHAQEPYQVFDEMVRFINKNLKGLEAIGISAPGPADYDKGQFQTLPNLPGWAGINLIDFLRNKTGFQKIWMQNDANLMALAQHVKHGGKKNDITQFFTVSTGLGGGLIINNEIFTGATGTAEEVAHLPVAWKRDHGPILGEGSLELFSSGAGIAFRAKAKYNSTEEVFKHYGKDDFATEIINDGIETLANSIAAVCGILNPSKFIFDGSVARYNSWYIERAIEISKNRMWPQQFAATQFIISLELGDDAAILGAAHYAISKK